MRDELEQARGLAAKAQNVITDKDPITLHELEKMGSFLDDALWIIKSLVHRAETQPEEMNNG